MANTQTELTGLGDGGLWVTVTELAERKGVRKSTVSERVKALEDAGKIQTKPGKGRAKLINLAQYDTAVGQVGDAARELGATTKAADRADDRIDEAPRTPVYRDAQEREKRYSADLKELDLRKRQGELVEISEVEAVMTRAAEAIVRIVDRLPMTADDLAAAVAREGVHGLRMALTKEAARMRADMAVALRQAGAAEDMASDVPAAEGTPEIAAPVLS